MSGWDGFSGADEFDAPRKRTNLLDMQRDRRRDLMGFVGRRRMASVKPEAQPAELVYAPGKTATTACASCSGSGLCMTEHGKCDVCQSCKGLGWYGIDPESPTILRPGSSGRVAVMAARYRAGRQLYHPEDAAL